MTWKILMLTTCTFNFDGSDPFAHKDKIVHWQVTEQQVKSCLLLLYNTDSQDGLFFKAIFSQLNFTMTSFPREGGTFKHHFDGGLASNRFMTTNLLGCFFKIQHEKKSLKGTVVLPQ